MKFKVVLALCICAFELTLGEIRMAGITRGTGIFGRIAQTPGAICNNDNKIGRSYCNGELPADCDSTGVVTCTSATSGYFIPCPPEKAHCFASTDGKAQCSEKPADGCTAVEPTFQCTDVGYYPDPSNCRVFYYCSKDKDPNKKIITPEPFFCPTGYVFDPNSYSKMYCLYTSTPSRCVTVTGCSDKAKSVKNVLMNYLGNAQFVALCLPDGDQPLIFQCPAGTKAVLENIPVTCSYTCKAQGLYEYRPDKSKYYDCKYDASKKLFSELRDCPTGTEFVKTTCTLI